MVLANRAAPAGPEISLRVGVNLGDVVGEGSDVFGDSVNIAARLEAIADPGSICISDKVFEEVQGKVAFAADDMGNQLLKNISRPVRVWKIRGSDDGAIPSSVLSRRDKSSIAVLPFDNL